MGLKNFSGVLAMVVFLVATPPATIAAGRDIATSAEYYSLAERLENNGGPVQCWSALMDIKSCSNEIVHFFLNGMADIGPECCRAVNVITHSCWPAMLSSLGFTPDESNVLKGYCDPSTPTPSAAPAPIPLSAASPLYFISQTNN